MTEALFAGMDLHSNNVMIGLMDQTGRRIKHQKLECHLPTIQQFLAPYRSRLKSLAVESTYNWYWLVDGLRALSYPIHLANPAQIQQYDQEGWLFLPSVFGADEAAMMAQEAQRIYAMDRQEVFREKDGKTARTAFAATLIAFAIAGARERPCALIHRCSNPRIGAPP